MSCSRMLPLFGTAQTEFVYTLLGNTQARKRPRQMTSEVDPKYLAVWTLERFSARLCQYVRHGCTTRWTIRHWGKVRVKRLPREYNWRVCAPILCSPIHKRFSSSPAPQLAPALPNSTPRSA